MSDHGTTVTIKYGKGYEETWAVFKGVTASNVRADIIDYFGMSHDAVAELTLHELVTNATDIAHGTGNAAALLGGVAIPASEAGAKPVQSTGGNPWEGLDDKAPQKEDWPAQKPEHEEEEQRLLNLIASQGTVADLQREVWAKNRPGFDKYPSVQAAYKARGKELSKK